ncbi:hypothetical protein C8F01DRAFT_275928 [Mycena amicta]|nr:hypothetical protein C8F01DRAFT_275928 [Mycena amicta]
MPSLPRRLYLFVVSLSLKSHGGLQGRLKMPSNTRPPQAYELGMLPDPHTTLSQRCQRQEAHITASRPVTAARARRNNTKSNPSLTSHIYTRTPNLRCGRPSPELKLCTSGHTRGWSGRYDPAAAASSRARSILDRNPSAASVGTSIPGSTDFRGWNPSVKKTGEYPVVVLILSL